MSAWWDVLDIPRGSDRDAIRRAYARKLKVTNPEDDPKGFMALREAYESALNWIEYDFDWVEDDAEGDGEAPEEVPAPVAREPVAPPVEAEVPAGAPDPEAEARAAEHADLRALTAALEAGLRGPWFADATKLKFLFGRLRDAPAMIEIETRDRIEYWLADLLADTIPRSDPILTRAIELFGWDNEGQRPPATWSILGRIDEWRMIQSLGESGHPLAAGWRSLSRNGEPAWQRRIGAMRPGIAAQVRQLLDIADYQAPGLAHSFDPDAAAWWRAHVERPRFGFVDLSALLLGALLAAGFATWGPTAAWRIGGGAVSALLGIALPALRLALVAPWRQRREREGQSAGWIEQGWAAPWLMAGLLLIGWPAGLWSAIAVGGLAAIAAVWMAIGAARDPEIGNPLHRILALAALALLGGAAFGALSDPAKIALTAFALATTLIRAAARGALGELLWRTGRPVLTAVILSCALIAAAAARDQLPGGPPSLLRWGAATFMSMTLLAAVRDVQDGSRLAAAVPLLRWGLWIALIVAAVMAAPPVERDAPLPSLVQRPAFEDAAEALEKSEPGFAALRTGNPALHRSIVAIRQQIAGRERNGDEGGREITRLVNQAYRARLPVAPAALVAAEFDIRLATLREYQARDLRACATDEPGPKVSKALQQRHFRHALAVAGSAPESADALTNGRTIAMSELLAVAANEDAGQARRMRGALTSEPAALAAFQARCAARIALLEALMAQRDTDIARTMRPGLIAQAASKPEKKS